MRRRAAVAAVVAVPVTCPHRDSHRETTCENMQMWKIMFTISFRMSYAQRPNVLCFYAPTKLFIPHSHTFPHIQSSSNNYNYPKLARDRMHVE